MRSFQILGCVFLLCSALDAGAQEPKKEKEEPPSLPLVTALPKMCAWTMTFKKQGRPDKTVDPNAAKEAAAEAAIRRITSIQNVQTGAVRLAIVNESNGTKTQFYHFGSRIVALPEGSAKPVVVEASSNIPFYDYYSSGIYGMNLIQVDDFKETVKVGKLSCHHYKGSSSKAGAATPIRGPGDGASASESLGYEAWINAETRLPVALREGTQIITYSFGSPPTSDLVLAPAFQQAWNEYQQDLARLQSMRRR